MKSIVRFSVNNAMFVNLISLFILIIGIVSALTLRREAFPNISFDMVMIRTDYFGAPPEEVEKLVTIKIEDELKEISGIDELNSVSSENISVIVAKLDPDASDQDKIVNDIQRAVDRVDDLPEDAEDPVVEEIQSKDLPVLNVSLSGELDELELQQLARQLEVLFLDLQDVARVDRMGWRDREIWVEVDPERVREDHLSLEEIILALKNKNLNLPGGDLETRRGEFLIRTIGEFETAEEIEQVIIRANDYGNWVRVKDVAEVKDAFEDDDLVERTFGHQAINLTIVKKEEGDIIRLVEEIKATAAEFQKNAPENLRISYFDDYSYYVKRRLNVLKNNGIVGIFFVVFALLIFLSRYAALMTALGIPIAVMTTFFLMDVSGMTINLITMFALIMVLGLVVDDSIVVSENVFRLIEDGMEPREAAVKGTQQVMAPVVVTVLTTVVAFIPLFFMGGIIGKYIFAIPIVIIIALMGSLFECLLILPSHMAETARFSRGAKRGEFHWFLVLREKYLKTLRWVLGHRYKAVGLFLVAFIASFILFKTQMKFVLFPQGLIEEFFIRAKAPIGTSLEGMAEKMRKVEELIGELPEAELENYVTQVGIIREDATDPYTDRGSHLGQIHVFLTPEKTKGRRNADAIIRQVREGAEKLDGLFEEVTYDKVRAGPPVGKPVSIRLRGDDLGRLEAAAEAFKTELKKIDGVRDVKDDYDVGKTELRVVVDETKASKTYLSIREIATTVRNAMEGGVATTIQKTDEEIDVLVRYPESERAGAEVFDEIYVPNRFDNLIPLKKVAAFEEKKGINAIRHLDRKRMINVTSDVDEEVVAPIAVGNQMASFFAEKVTKEFPEIIMRFGGEQEETQESLQDFFRALLMALFFIAVLLAGYFQSLSLSILVMSAIPFGLMGVILAFFFHGKPLSFMALLGLLGLSGVVINDSIVLVSFIKSLRHEGIGRFDSIMEAGKMRLRPVLLTSITTVVGLMPVAYGIGGSDPFLKPMALAIGWGLVFATVLTLILIPCLYSIADDIGHLFDRLLKKAVSEAQPPG